MRSRDGLALIFAVAAVAGGVGCSGRATMRPPPPPPGSACTAPSNPNPPSVGWTWMSGSELQNQAGVYGILGVASPNNTPGSRVYPAKWADAAGDLWLFGGYGAATTVQTGRLNDLWEYTSGGWVWVGGTEQLDQSGVYGTQGVAAKANLPGGREEPASWTDPSGNFWLFGGTGRDANGNPGTLNDLWKYSNGEWTWLTGSSTLTDVGGNFRDKGVYGTRGVPAAGNTPGSRFGAVTWTDGAGKLWLFGGEGADSAGTLGILNDLWEFDPATNMWAWMSGSNVVNAFGVYGAIGVAAPANVPGARSGAAGWTDGVNLWLFGGEGNDANGRICERNGGPCALNDLWEFSGGEWAWVAGASISEVPGTYGTETMPDSANIPGARDGATTWVDSGGDFWLFGGEGYACSGGRPVFGQMNDLWEDTVLGWVWWDGSSQPGDPGTYGALGTSTLGDTPGARLWAAAWPGLSGKLWLFGGFNGSARLNDLWRFTPHPNVMPLNARANWRLSAPAREQLPPARVLLAVRVASSTRRPTR